MTTKIVFGNRTYDVDSSEDWRAYRAVIRAHANLYQSGTKSLMIVTVEGNKKGIADAKSDKS